jgi:hypothetical protein
MLIGREVVDFFSHVMGSVMGVGVVVGLVSALLGCAAVALGRGAFAPFATWSVALLAASTGVAVGTWLPLAVVGAAGAAAFVAGTILQARGRVDAH